ncbi:MAG: hypothetical protein NVS1B4_07750 [Gemmatimonadaceae bacterium]
MLIGASRFPAIAGSVGKGIREFKHGASGDADRGRSVQVTVVPPNEPRHPDRAKPADRDRSEPKRLIL